MRGQGSVLFWVKEIGVKHFEDYTKIPTWIEPLVLWNKVNYALAILVKNNICSPSFYAEVHIRIILIFLRIIIYLTQSKKAHKLGRNPINSITMPWADQNNEVK